MNNKRITKTGTFVITLLQILFFSLTWYLDYNDKMFHTYKELGFYSCIAIWVVIYLWCCSLYRAFSFASTSAGETVFSQFISFGLADLVLYFISILLSRQYVSIWPGVMCVVIQLTVAIVGVTNFKTLLMKKMIPYKTVVFYGPTFNEATALQFSKRLLHKYSHMFNIVTIVEDADDLYKCDVDIVDNDENCIDSNIKNEIEACNYKRYIDEHERVIFLGINYEHRKVMTKHCLDNKKVFYFVPEIEEIIFMNCDTKNLLDTPLKRYSYSNERFAYVFLKRAIDIGLSALLLLVLWPVMLLTAIAIRLDDWGPAIFTQKRVTKNERIFTIYKFRSMVMDADNVEKYGVRPTIDNDPRVTRVGKIIRAIRIDELPQLFNILKGDMSFVGPRPERIEHVQKYESYLPEFKYRHMVRGGLTGYAQVFGKYNTSPEDKLKWDLLYIMGASLFLDAKLFLMTIRTVFQAESTDGFDEEQVKRVKA